MTHRKRRRIFFMKQKISQFLRRERPDNRNILYLGGFIRRVNDSAMNVWMLYLPLDFVLWYDFRTHKLHFERIGYIWRTKEITFKIKVWSKLK